MSAKFGFAGKEDGKGVLEIMESDIAKGDIQLLYTRRPDAYASLMEESSKTVVGIFKDDEKIVGTVTGIPRTMWINGGKKTVCYVTGMKCLGSYPGLINWIEAFQKMYDPLDSDIYYCSIVKENTDVIKMLKKVRKKLPFSVGMDFYRTYIISPTAKVKNPCPELSFSRATEDDEAAILDFLKKYGQCKNFFPDIPSFEEENVPDLKDFYLLKDGEAIRAVGALWDRSHSKQYVVKKYANKVKLLRIMNPVISKIGYITLPKEDTEVKFTFLSFFLAEDENADYYRSFLHHIRSEVKKKYAMFVLGTNEHNAKRAVLDEVRSIKFDTELCEVVMSNFRGAERINMDYHNLEVECALL